MIRKFKSINAISNLSSPIKNLTVTLQINPHPRKTFSSTINTDIKNYYEVYTELRSDVKTIPTENMRKSVLDLNFGDDSFEEDPTVNRLYKKLTDLFGKEKALLLPSGTMANIVGLSINVNRDDYILQGERSHLNKTESNSQRFAGFNRILSKDIDNPKNDFNVEQIVNKEHSHINPSKIKVIAFENSHNYNGGKILNTEIVDKIVKPQIKISKKFNHLKFHLDGSRLLNAAVALKTDPKILIKLFDTINICLSKGIGAPCGSILLMDEKDYEKAREIRKYLGGSMRQAGFIAAPALVALEDWKERFEEDHFKTKLLADGISKIKGFKVIQPETNILNVYPDEILIKQIDLPRIVDKLEKDYKVLVHSMDNNQYIRAVLHHQVSRDKIIFTIECFQKAVNEIFHDI
jgi:threonine aldolase